MLSELYQEELVTQELSCCISFISPVNNSIKSCMEVTTPKRAHDQGGHKNSGRLQAGQGLRWVNAISKRLFSDTLTTNLQLGSISVLKFKALKTNEKQQVYFQEMLVPKFGSGGRTNKQYFPYQIPATNNVIHSNLPQSASKNCLLNFVSNKKVLPENQSVTQGNVNINKPTKYAPSLPGQLP